MKANYIKELRTLLESEVEEAEVIIAAKGFGQELQDMIEKIGRLMNEDLGPVADQMRNSFGEDMAQSFHSSMQEEMQAVLETLRGTKDKIDAAVSSISQGQSINMGNDMDMEMGGDEMGMAGDEFDAGMGDEFDMGGDEMGMDDEFDAGMDDEFGAEGDLVEPLGRATKESRKAFVRNQLVEMRAMLEIAKAKKKVNKTNEATDYRDHYMDDSVYSGGPKGTFQKIVTLAMKSYKTGMNIKDSIEAGIMEFIADEQKSGNKTPLDNGQIRWLRQHAAQELQSKLKGK